MLVRLSQMFVALSVKQYQAKGRTFCVPTNRMKQSQLRLDEGVYDFSIEVGLYRLTDEPCRLVKTNYS